MLEEEVVEVGVGGEEVAPGERGAEDRHGGGIWGHRVNGLECSTHLGGLASWELGAACFIGGHINRNAVVLKPGRTTMILQPMVLSSMLVRHTGLKVIHGFPRKANIGVFGSFFTQVWLAKLSHASFSLF